MPTALSATGLNERRPSFMKHSSEKLERQSCPLCYEKNIYNNFSVFTSCSPATLREVPSIETLSVEMESLRRHLSQIDSPTVLCHNDLLTKNIIYNHTEGEDQWCTSLKHGGYNGDNKVFLKLFLHVYVVGALKNN